MKRPTVTHHNLENNEIKVGEMNDTEFAQWEIDKANFDAQKQAEDAASQAKATAELKLEALGITAGDLKALGL